MNWPSVTTVTPIMTKNVISVRPETPLVEAAQILSNHRFNGLPVVDEENHLVGILTEYDLISSKSAIHIPTFQMLIQQLPVFQKDKSPLRQNAAAVLALQVKDVMNKEPLTFSPEDSFEKALTLFRKHHRVNPIPVVDAEKKIVGIVSRSDIVKMFSNLLITK